MNWITNYVRPKINSMLGRRDMPENLWIKDPETGEMVFHKDLEENQWVIPSSGHHMRISARDRLRYFLDDGKYEVLDSPKVPVDPLKFRDEKRYGDRLRDARTKTGLEDTILSGLGTVEGLPIVATVQDFAFIGGSLGMAAGEAIIKAFETAIEQKRPMVLFAASGGARMQEGTLSLMQLPRTTVAVDRLKEAGLPYIVVLTNPTTGGVTASYAMLGDIHIAEPGALIGFAGPARHRADDPREAAGGFPAGRISDGARHGRHGRAAARTQEHRGAAAEDPDEGFRNAGDRGRTGRDDPG